MDDRAYWAKQLREAEAELDAARTRTALNAAAKKLQRAKAELKALEGEGLPAPLFGPAALLQDGRRQGATSS